MLQFSGSYYRCIELHFGWGPSALCCTKLLRPVLRHLREKWGYSFLPYLDDFLVTTARPGRASTEADCAQAHQHLDSFFRRLSLTRQPEKGCWSGDMTLEHLSVTLDT